MTGIIDISILVVFIPTFFLVSITPGMCMTLAMTLGMTIGLRRTFWMMSGELLGVGVVSVAAVVGVATIMLRHSLVFNVFKYVGGAYLLYLGIQLWLSQGKMAVSASSGRGMGATRAQLAAQGFVTAVANPKGWGFMISLLPPFINPQYPMTAQLSILILIIMSTEFICMCTYASGGKTLRRYLQRQGNVQVMNRISGSLMLGIGLWLALG
ncbi:MAG: LysE family translocator [Desulfobacteraceae bacterium]|nr:LysE family translocator [Desulfobacteraceae bacterium]